MTDVCLVTMPYYNPRRPSLALGLLKSSLTEVSITSEVIYSNLKFAQKIGLANYNFIDNISLEDLLGEWTFSQKAFSRKTLTDYKADDAEYLKLAEKILRTTLSENQLNITLKGKKFEEYFYDLRRKASEFIDSEAERILEKNPRIVGCGSTFQEHCSSLALLRRIRELAPGVITMMGGANCEDTLGMVTHNRFEWVDYMVLGEAEFLLPGLCKKILKMGREIEPDAVPPGVLGPAHRGSHTNFTPPPRSIIKELDKSPIPDYDDYFENIKHSPIKNYLDPLLLIETSRGCWWGHKKPCTFCGLNGNVLTYRSKSPERVLSELEILSGKYGINNFLAVDNILDMKYFKTLLPRLKKSGKKYLLGYETKANLSKEQVKLLAGAGVITIQPGIESLNNQVLEKLNKGNKSWTNIELLKWTREYGINSQWSLLNGLPDDNDDWYKEIAEIIPLITHLQPPMNVHKIFYTRFSQYYNDPGKYNIELKPIPAYSYVYPLSKEELDKFALFFTMEKTAKTPGNGKEKEPSAGINRLFDEVRQWQQLWHPFRVEKKEIVELGMEESEEEIKITDTRPCSPGKHIKLEGLPALVYKICDIASTSGKILSKLKEKGYTNIQWENIKPILDDLQGKKILLKLENRFLSLAVRKSAYKFFWEYNSGELDINKQKIEIPKKENQPEMESPACFSMDKSLEELFGKRKSI